MPANPRFDIQGITSIIRNDSTNHSGDMSVNKKDSKAILLDQPFNIGFLRPDDKEGIGRLVDSLNITMSPCRYILASDHELCENVRTILAKVLPGRSISDVPAEIALTAALSVEAIVNPNGGMIRKTIINNNEIVNELIEKFGEMVRLTIGVGEAKKQEEVSDPDSTEAALQRVEELKFRYASTNKDDLNNLCTLLRKIADEIKAIDGLKMSLEEASKRKAEILEAYGLKKWRGERKEGMRPMPFLEKYYEKWLSAGVLFKADLRVLDKELVAAFRDRHTQYGEVDPLLTESQRTEMLAAGIFGDEHEQQRAYRLLFIRPGSRKITAFLRS